MGPIILSMLMTAAIFAFPAAVPSQEQDGIGEVSDTDEAMNNDMMMDGMGAGGMGTDGYGIDMMDGCGTGHRTGMMRGAGRGLGLGPYWVLDLTPDQRKKLNRIHVELQKQLWSLKGKTIDERARLYELYSAERPDPKKIGAVYSALFDVRRQVIEAKIEAKNRAREVLNKEQLEKLRKLQQNRMRGVYQGAMMNHGADRR